MAKEGAALSGHSRWGEKFTPDPAIRKTCIASEGYALARLRVQPAWPLYKSQRAPRLVFKAISYSQRGSVLLEKWGAEAVDSRETYFVLRDVDHEVDPSGRTAEELAEDEPHRWWTLAEVAAGVAVFAPRELAAVLPRVLEGPWAGPPRIVD